MITINICGNNWGTGRHADIHAVLSSAKAQIVQYLREDIEATIDVARRDEGPEINRNSNGLTNYKIWLNTKDMRWAQYTYQFSHELCHMLANFKQRFRKPNQWFEESICEMASLFTLRSMKDTRDTWDVPPPYQNWESYGVELLKYADDVSAQAIEKTPDNAAWKEWISNHENMSRSCPYKRLGNRIIALRMLPLFEDCPQRWNAIRRLPVSKERLETFLAQWENAVDQQDRDFIQQVRDVLLG